MESTERREKLKDIFYSIKECNKCGLSRTRTNFVFGSGNANSKLMFVGEAPGKNEDLQGKPFVGQAGKLLDDLLNSIGFVRNEVFIANVLKCRPPQNRDPRIEE
ncbi:uracil-DNA glycosylase, partial [bacterium]|nr:uracil-DNA glycosylase [bacterium]